MPVSRSAFERTSRSAQARRTRPPNTPRSGTTQKLSNASARSVACSHEQQKYTVASRCVWTVGEQYDACTLSPTHWRQVVGPEHARSSWIAAACALALALVALAAIRCRCVRRRDFVRVHFARRELDHEASRGNQDERARLFTFRYKSRERAHRGRLRRRRDRGSGRSRRLRGASLRLRARSRTGLRGTRRGSRRTRRGTRDGARA